MTDKAISGTDSRNYDRLLPCPFCGGKYTQVRWIGFKDKNKGAFESGFRGECTECFALTRAFSTEAEAIEAWNTRTDPEFGSVAMTEENMAAHGWAKVVRCRDCKWCMAYSNATYCDRFAHALPTVEPDGFCAWGERRDA